MLIVSDVVAVLDGPFVYRPNQTGVFEVADRVGIKLLGSYGARRPTPVEAATVTADPPSIIERDGLIE